MRTHVSAAVDRTVGRTNLVLQSNPSLLGSQARAAHLSAKRPPFMDHHSACNMFAEHCKQMRRSQTYMHASHPLHLKACYNILTINLCSQKISEHSFFKQPACASSSCPPVAACQPLSCSPTAQLTGVPQHISGLVCWAAAWPRQRLKRSHRRLASRQAALVICLAANQRKRSDGLQRLCQATQRWTRRAEPCWLKPAQSRLRVLAAASTRTPAQHWTRTRSRHTRRPEHHRRQAACGSRHGCRLFCLLLP